MGIKDVFLEPHQCTHDEMRVSIVTIYISPILIPALSNDLQVIAVLILSVLVL